MTSVARDLIDRLQNAEGPSKELDKAICDLLLLPLEPITLDPVDSMWKDDPLGRMVRDAMVAAAPNYTASIDKALTLIPPGWTRSVDASLPEAGIRVDIYRPNTKRTDIEFKAYGDHRVEAIATCIAALRARFGK